MNINVILHAIFASRQQNMLSNANAGPRLSNLTDPDHPVGGWFCKLTLRIFDENLINSETGEIFVHDESERTIALHSKRDIADIFAML